MINDSEKVISTMKAAYGDLKAAIANNAVDDEKKMLTDHLVNAVKAFDAKMKTIRQAMPKDHQPKAKSKAKAKAAP